MYLKHTIKTRDAQIAIFLADSDFQFFGKCDLPKPIFFLRTIIDSIYKQKPMHISTNNDLHNKRNLKKNYNPPNLD